MSRKTKIILSVVSTVLILAILTVTLVICLRPPKYEEIEERFRALIEASYELNELFFWEGLPTYERVYDPWENMEVYKELKEDGSVNRYIYYCYMTDQKANDILAYRIGTLNPETVYLQISSVQDPDREAVYVDETGGRYFYETDYTPPSYDFFYSEKDPAQYDYVRRDSPYGSVQELKNLAATVYSADCLKSVYATMFDGVYSEAEEYVEGFSPRYYEYTDEAGNMSLMKSNTYSPIGSRNVFDFSTAKLVWVSHFKRVTIQIEFYPEQNPSARDTMEIVLVRENGQWMLDSHTY